MKLFSENGAPHDPGTAAAAGTAAERVRRNQQRLTAHLRPHYDFIVCGAGTAGSVVARRLAENPAAQVLLLEAGGDDEAPAVTDPGQWPANLGSERDWGFRAEPNPRLNGRAIPLNMGKGLGGGSSVNVMVWSRGHRHDWDFFAREAGEPAWGYPAVLDLYRRVEDWQGWPDPARRGTAGPVFVQSAPDPHPVARALLEGARAVGIPTFDSPNGRMMEGEGGCAIVDLLVRGGQRRSIFRAYTFPYMDRPNLTVLTRALVTRVLFEGRRARGVEFVRDGAPRRVVGAGREVVLCLGAIHTPKVLLQSGLGDETELRRLGIPPVEHLPGVGQNFQDHVLVAGCLWEFPQPQPPRNNAGEATLFWKSDPGLDTPDLQPFQAEIPFLSPELAARTNPLPAHAWGLFPGVVRPRSRGWLRLTGPHPQDPVEIHANTFGEPDDFKALVRGVELCREIGNSAALRPFVKREVLPGKRRGGELENFIRDGAVTYWHQSGTAKMGRDSMSVVDGRLKVYGVDGLRVADGSTMPRVTTGNTMAPCVVIGERAAEFIKAAHQL